MYIEFLSLAPKLSQIACVIVLIDLEFGLCTASGDVHALYPGVHNESCVKESRSAKRPRLNDLFAARIADTVFPRLLAALRIVAPSVFCSIVRALVCVMGAVTCRRGRPRVCKKKREIVAAL